MKKIIAISAASLLVPGLAFAQSGDGLGGVLDTIYGLLSALIPIIIVLATVFFFYGVAKFILNAGDSEGRQQGIQIMIYGIIGLFVIVSVWGLVALLQETFGLDEQANTQTSQGPSDFGDLIPGGGSSNDVDINSGSI